MDRKARGNEFRLAGGEHQRRIEAGAQVQPRGTCSGIGGQREFLADARIENADLERATRIDGGNKRIHADTLVRRGPFLRSAYCSAISVTRSRASATLGACGNSRRPSRQITSSALSSFSNTLSCPTSFAAIMSRFFLRSFCRAYCSTESVSAANPTTNGRALPTRAATVARMSTVRSILRSIDSDVFLILLSTGFAGR